MAINDKQQAFINEYMVNGHNASKAYAKAYPDSSDKACESNGARLIGKDKIKAEIDRRIAEKNKRHDLSRNAQHDRLMSIIEDRSASPSVQVSALRELNEMLGFHRDKAPNREREESILRHMTCEERKIAELLARHRTRQVGLATG